MTSVLVPALVALGVGVVAAEIIAGIVVAVTVSVVTGFIAQALAPKPKRPEFGFAAAASSGRTQLVRQPITAWRIVYGEVRLSGPLTFVQSTDNNNLLHMLVTVAARPSAGMGEVQFNDEIIPLDSSGDATGNWAGFATVKKGLGTASTDADLHTALKAISGSQWTSAHKQTGRSKIYVKMKFNRDLIPGALPTPTVIVRGSKLYDPRVATVVIASSSAATPSVFDTAPTNHGLSANQHIWIKGHAGSDPVVEKGYQVGTVPSPTTFTLLDRAEDPLGLSTGGTGGTFSVMVWSNNPALASRDYVVDESIGRKAKESEISDSDVITAANVCDEQVAVVETNSNFAVDAATDIVTLVTAMPQLATGNGIQVSSTGTLPSPLAAATTYYWHRLSNKTGFICATLQDALAGVAINLTDAGSPTHNLVRKSEQRYTCNGVFNADDDPKAILAALGSSMAGHVFKSGERWVILAGAWRPPVVTIDENIADGPIKVQTRVSRRELANGIKGVFVNPAKAWQPDDFPAVVNATYLAADQGTRLWKDIDLPFTTSSSTAQRIAKIDLEKMRQQISVVYPANLKAVRLRAGQVVNVTNERFGWSAKPFEVVDWGFRVRGTGQNIRLGVDLFLRETAAAVYDWNSGEETTQDAAPDTNLPNPFTVAAPTGMALSTRTFIQEGGAENNQAVVSWTQHPDAFVREDGKIEVAFKLESEATWRPSFFVRGPETEAFVTDVLPSTRYDFRIRAVNYRGAKSAWQNIFGYTIGAPGAGANEQKDYGLVTEIPPGLSIERGSVAETHSQSIDYGTIT